MSDLSQPSCGFHLELRVADLTHSTQFYTKLFDREPKVSVHDKYSLFEFWELQLLLLIGKTEKARFGFQLHSIQQLNLWEKQLIQRGISTERQQMFHGALDATEIAVNITDPDGHRCSFYVLNRQLVPVPKAVPDNDSRSF